MLAAVPVARCSAGWFAARGADPVGASVPTSAGAVRRRDRRVARPVADERAFSVARRVPDPAGIISGFGGAVRLAGRTRLPGSSGEQAVARGGRGGDGFV